MLWNTSNVNGRQFDLRCVIAALVVMLGSHGACYAASAAHSDECTLTPGDWWSWVVEVVTIADRSVASSIADEINDATGEPIGSSDEEGTAGEGSGFSDPEADAPWAP